VKIYTHNLAGFFDEIEEFYHKQIYYFQPNKPVLQQPV